MLNQKAKIRLLITLVLAIVLVSGTLVFGAEAPEVHYSKTTLRPGDFFQVLVKAAPGTKVTIKFLDRSKGLYPVERTGFSRVDKWLASWHLKRKGELLPEYRCLVAVPSETAPGAYPLTVELGDGPGQAAKEQMIHVINRDFPEQRITVPDQMVAETIAVEKKSADEQAISAIVAKAASSKGAPLWRGRFMDPLVGRQTTDFGMRRYVNDIGNGRHSGWDLAVPTGTDIVAINRGRVVFAGDLNVTGNTVIIHHGLDLFSLYAHLSKLEVKAGRLVRKGDPIGRVGSTGLSTGPHLHLTVRIGDTPVEPGLFLGQSVGWKWQSAELQR